MNHHQHDASIRPYIFVWLALTALTVITVVVAEIELGEWNIVLAMTIAIIKALLVVLYFMHVKHATSLTKLFVGAGLLWMLILFSLTLGDYFSRGWLSPGRWW